MGGRLPQVALDSPEPAVRYVFARFCEEGREPIALYRIMAGAPWLVEAYSELSRGMRDRASLPRALRELVILRSAQLAESDYEWSHHRKMALAIGVSEKKMRKLARWRQSGAFDHVERVALACVEAIHEAQLNDDCFAEMRGCFTEPETIELISICAFYEMVARLVQALGVEVEPAYRQFLSDGPSATSP